MKRLSLPFNAGCFSKESFKNVSKNLFVILGPVFLGSE